MTPGMTSLRCHLRFLPPPITAERVVRRSELFIELQSFFPFLLSAKANVHTINSKEPELIRLFFFHLFSGSVGAANSPPLSCLFLPHFSINLAAQLMTNTVFVVTNVKRETTRLIAPPRAERPVRPFARPLCHSLALIRAESAHDVFHLEYGGWNCRQHGG